MKIWYWRYELRPRRALSAVARAGLRAGALLRVDDGFADVHPWVELGDATLDEQLAMLARGDTTSLTRRSLEMARVDGDARRRGISLFDGLAIPASHWTGDDPPPEFDTAKVKCGADFDPARVPPRVRLRLDFNETLAPGELEKIARKLPRERIDFIEDGTPYDRAIWSRLRETTGVRMARDRGVEREGVDVLVVKPAVQEIPLDDAREIVITSYMDHAVGQLGAAWVAAVHRERVSARCGLFTHVLFEPDEFSSQLGADGATLVPPRGTGIGLDEALGKLPWRRLA